MSYGPQDRRRTTPGHHSLHTLRPPCPPRPSRVAELMWATGAGAGLGRVGTDTAVWARVRRRIRAGGDASLRPCSLFPLAWGPLTGAAHMLLPCNSPRQMGRGGKILIAVPDRVAAAARLLPGGRKDRGLAGGRSRAPPEP